MGIRRLGGNDLHRIRRLVELVGVRHICVVTLGLPDGIGEGLAEVLLLVLDGVKGDVPTTIGLCLEHVSIGVEQLELELPVQRDARHRTIHHLRRMELDRGHLERLGRVATVDAVIHSGAVGHVSEVHDEPYVLGVIATDRLLVPYVHDMRIGVIAHVELVVALGIQELHPAVLQLIIELDLAFLEAIVVPELEGVGDPLVGGVLRNDRLVDTLLTAGGTVVIPLEDVVAMLLIGLVVGVLVVDFGTVGVLDVLAALGDDPVVDLDGAIEEAGGG